MKWRYTTERGGEWCHEVQDSEPPLTLGFNPQTKKLQLYQQVVSAASGEASLEPIDRRPTDLFVSYLEACPRGKTNYAKNISYLSDALKNSHEKGEDEVKVWTHDPKGNKIEWTFLESDDWIHHVDSSSAWICNAQHQELRAVRVVDLANRKFESVDMGNPFGTYLGDHDNRVKTDSEKNISYLSDALDDVQHNKMDDESALKTWTRDPEGNEIEWTYQRKKDRYRCHHQDSHVRLICYPQERELQAWQKDSESDQWVSMRTEEVFGTYLEAHDASSAPHAERDSLPRDVNRTPRQKFLNMIKKDRPARLMEQTRYLKRLRMELVNELKTSEGQQAAKDNTYNELIRNAEELVQDFNKQYDTAIKDWGQDSPFLKLPRWFTLEGKDTPGGHAKSRLRSRERASSERTRLIGEFGKTAQLIQDQIRHLRKQDQDTSRHQEVLFPPSGAKSSITLSKVTIREVERTRWQRFRKMVRNGTNQVVYDRPERLELKARDFNRLAVELEKRLNNPKWRQAAGDDLHDSLIKKVGELVPAFDAQQEKALDGWGEYSPGQKIRGLVTNESNLTTGDHAKLRQRDRKGASSECARLTKELGRIARDAQAILQMHEAMQLSPEIDKTHLISARDSFVQSLESN